MYKIQYLKMLSLKDVRSYIHTVNSWKILSFEEEQILTKKIYYYSDYQAIQKIILSNLRFVVHITRNYLGYGLPQSDLIQEGNIGLMKAVRRFNPYIKVRVISFAIYWIKSEIHEYILKNWRIVKIATTKAQRKLFFNLRKTKKKLQWFNLNEMKNIAHFFGVKRNDVSEMENRMSVKDIDLYFTNTRKITDVNTKHHFPCLIDYKSDFAAQLEEKNWEIHTLIRLKNAMLNLDQRSRYIIYVRWLCDKNKITLQKIANNYGISSERVRQLEKQAIQKLKLYLKK